MRSVCGWLSCPNDKPGRPARAIRCSPHRGFSRMQTLIITRMDKAKKRPVRFRTASFSSYLRADAYVLENRREERLFGEHRRPVQTPGLLCGLLVLGPLFEHHILAGFDSSGQFRFPALEEILGVVQGIRCLALEFTAFLGKQVPRFFARPRCI